MCYSNFSEAYKRAEVAEVPNNHLEEAMKTMAHGAPGSAVLSPSKLRVIEWNSRVKSEGGKFQEELKKRTRV